MKATAEIKIVSEKAFWHNSILNKFIEIDNFIPVTIHGFDCAIHQMSDGWVVTELMTGGRVSIGKDIEEAKKNAEKRLKNRKKAIDILLQSISENGLSPRYSFKFYSIS